ncbi:dephospho-CoA kinase [Allofranklinella schreckenbergeri]|uniref:Dephospho-CoA kinase n=1 Tax=Allofranklinella schreckenbergeri TaxID=1076744 RepID=A0A3M6Q7R8_9BURK|nr:dephospho-CoA kinase [Allofranklinella schreckenbergeri]RMW98458.1 dephospho-CoA kinase [Allofranklinella schreckenbergeri]
MAPGQTLRIGLTGGIGSGKSTVAALLSAHCWAEIIDADHISRSLTAAGGAAIGPIAAQFGEAFIDGSGAMDRQRMRELVFRDALARRALEDLLHPLIFQAIHAAIDQARAPVVVLDLPLLVESARWRPWLDGVWVVDCPVEIQIERVQRRSQLERASVERIVQTQASRARRLRAADMVVFNGDISQSALTCQVVQAARLWGVPLRPE